MRRTFQVFFAELVARRWEKPIYRGEKEAEMLASARLGVWAVIESGRGIVTVNDFRASLDGLNDSERMEKTGKRLRISENASDVLGSPAFSFSEEYRRVRLVKASLQHLGLCGRPSRELIYYNAARLGLDKCSAEVGPLLRLHYLNQPKGERLLVGSDPIKGGKLDDEDQPQLDGYQDLFLLDADEQTLWLRAVGGASTARWEEDFQWIFADFS